MNAGLSIEQISALRSAGSTTPFPTILVPLLQRVPAGMFWMGENEADKFANDTERPLHPVTISRDVWFGVYPVTIGEYRSFSPGFREGEDEQWPVSGVSWYEATEYCAWLAEMTGDAFRLPTEAEWEYAARADATTAYSWGDEIQPTDANYLYDEAGQRVGPGAKTPVGSYSANAFGLHDTHGNAGEWMQDNWHPNYDGAPEDSSAWLTNPDDEQRVIRGGAWDYLPRLLRTCWRDGLPASTRRDNLGFRVVCDL